MTTQSITSGQEKQIIRFGSDALEKAIKELGADKDGAQRVIEHGDDFSALMHEAALTALRTLSVPNQFANEEVRSTFMYPPGYVIQDIGEQVAMLIRLFPQLNAAGTLAFVKDVFPKIVLPQLAEGWFATPRWQKLAPTYSAALEVVLAKIAESRKFYNYREGELGDDRLRQHSRTVRMLEEIAKQQPGDILIIPAQFGLRHRGRSVRRAREVFTSTEFGFGAVACGSMLLTHPPREVKWEQLHMDCSGDEYDVPVADDRFYLSPYLFLFSDGRVRFDTRWVGSAYERYGTVSGFLPQYPGA